VFRRGGYFRGGGCLQLGGGGAICLDAGVGEEEGE